ncbi:hypothetical protein GC167_00605 [bacterium]|nr:hypothetical protein [bacterium]
MQFGVPLWPGLLLLLLIPLGTALAYFRNDKLEGVPGPIRGLLPVLRALSLGLLVFLLLQPVWLRTTAEEKPPILALVLDVSRSMGAHPGVDTVALKEQIKGFQEAVEPTYELRTYQFGTRLEAYDPVFRENGTDLSSALRQINRELRIESGLAGLVLATDGRWNQGSEPRSFGLCPVDAVAIGKPESSRDAWVSDFSGPERVQKDNRIELVAALRAKGCTGETWTVELLEADRVVERRTWVPDAPDRRIEMRFFPKPPGAGTHVYSIRLQGPSPDSAPANNLRRHTVLVINEKAEIWIVYGSVHPDIGALVRGLEQNGGHSVRLFAEKNLPTAVDAAVLMVYEPNPAALPQLQKALNVHKGGVWLWASTPRSLGVCAELQKEVRFAGSNGGVERVEAALDADFGRFRIEPAAFDPMPKIEVPFGRWTLGSGVAMAARQKVGGLLSDRPLMLAFRDEQQRPWAFWTGRDYWQWPMEASKSGEKSGAFGGFCADWVRYLLSSPERDRLRLDHPSAVERYEPLLIRATVFDQTAQPSVQAKVSLTLADPLGKVTEHAIFAEQSDYAWRTVPSRSGLHQFEVKAQLGDEVLTASGRFTVGETPREALQSGSDTAILGSLARSSSGRMWLYQGKETWGALAEALVRNPAPGRWVERTRAESFAEWPWILAGAILLWLLEWYLRRRHGVY